jgi:hypothetical protein
LCSWIPSIEAERIIFVNNVDSRKKSRRYIKNIELAFWILRILFHKTACTLGGAGEWLLHKHNGNCKEDQNESDEEEEKW